MNAKDIMPTGTCFDDAIDIVTSMMMEKPELFHSDKLFIVHAICKSKSGILYAHGWVEDRIDDIDMVLWQGLLQGERICFGTDLHDHYEAHNPTVVIKYSPKQAWQENTKSGHYGPWDEEVRKHCAKPGDGGKPIDAISYQPGGEMHI